MAHYSPKILHTADGVRLYYEMHRGTEDAPWVFFLHGVGGDADAWQYLRANLLAQGFSTITMDLRGHGHSDHPRDTNRYALENFVDDVRTILDQEQIKNIFLVAHCFGTIVALRFALKYVERLHGLALISGTDRPPLYLRSPSWVKAASLGVTLLSTLSLPPIRPGHSYYPPGKIHKDYEWFGLARTMLRNSFQSYLMATKQFFTLGDLHAKLSTITTPTLIMVGEQDSIFPPSISQSMHAAIKGSVLHIVPGANHVLPLNEIDVVSNTIAQFLHNQKTPK